MLTDKQKFENRWHHDRGIIEESRRTLTNLTTTFCGTVYARMTIQQLDSHCDYLHRLNDSRAIELGLNIKRWRHDDEG